MTMGIYKMHIKETNIKNRVNLIKAKKKKKNGNKKYFKRFNLS